MIEASSRSVVLPLVSGSRVVAARASGSATARASDLMSAVPSSRTYTAPDAVGETTAPGTERSRSTARASRPAPPAAVTTKAAAVRSRVSAASAPSSVAVAPSSEPARATVTSTGAATAAVRRTPAAAFSRTSRPVAPDSRAGSRARSPDSGPTTTGASIATAVISSIGRLTYVLRCSRPPGSPASAMPSVTRAVSSRPPPNSHRPHVIAPVSTDASRSACVGAVRPARQDAASTPHRATRSPVQNAVWYGQVWSPMVNQAGARPLSTTRAARCGAPHAPSTQPAAEASTPTPRASATTSARSCPGVAPAVRSSPNSRRRCATVKANVEATTNTDTKAVTPPAVPNMAFIAVSASRSRSGSASASLRSSPVRTRTPGPARTASRTAEASASTVS